MGKILLFYKYITVPCPKQILTWQQAICTRLNFTGRIILAHEGINGTIGGSISEIEQYKYAMAKHKLFHDIDFKEGEGDESHFPRLKIVIKEEIVRLGINPQQLTIRNRGTHLTPKQAHNLIKQQPNDLLLLDCRNTYESCVGTFTKAVRPNIQRFREFPTYIDNNHALFKNKQVLMFCTGGIRCERASAYVKKLGNTKEVYQIMGGIHRYVEQYPDGFFRGKNYVFDRRVTVRVNNDILSACYTCKKPCDIYTNCLNAECNKHYLSCELCRVQLNNTCGEQCKLLVATKKVKKRLPLHTYLSV